MPAQHVAPREYLIVTIARLLSGCRHVAVGAASPIPAAGAMLLRALHADAGAPVRVSVLGSVAHNFFTNGGVELFDCAAQGRIDAFFLGGGQIDGQGNINLVGIGDHAAPRVRWPGSFGSSHLAFVVPRIILFREEHSRRVLVDRVDFVSAPGTGPQGVFRTGGPRALVTGKAHFLFDPALGRFRLETIHPGHTLAEIIETTGFCFDHAADPPPTAPPDARTLDLLRSRVLDELAETYPTFAASLQREMAGG
jgi:glutaconate CoA-transferase subunit B